MLGGLTASKIDSSNIAEEVHPINSAPFAFNLAKEDASKRGINLEGKQRSQMENDSDFDELFTEAKQRVSTMKIRVIEIIAPIEQTLFSKTNSLRSVAHTGSIHCGLMIQATR